MPLARGQSGLKALTAESRRRRTECRRTLWPATFPNSVRPSKAFPARRNTIDGLRFIAFVVASLSLSCSLHAPDNGWADGCRNEAAGTYSVSTARSHENRSRQVTGNPVARPTAALVCHRRLRPNRQFLTLSQTIARRSGHDRNRMNGGDVAFTVTDTIPTLLFQSPATSRGPPQDSDQSKCLIDPRARPPGPRHHATPLPLATHLSDLSAARTADDACRRPPNPANRRPRLRQQDSLRLSRSRRVQRGDRQMNVEKRGTSGEVIGRREPISSRMRAALLVVVANAIEMARTPPLERRTRTSYTVGLLSRLAATSQK